MCEWKTLRILCILLLCLPLVHFTLSVSRDLTQYLDPSPKTWDREIEQLAKDDLLLSLPEDPILVVGGQRVRLWRDLPARLQPSATLLRPLGDATLEDLYYHYDRLIGFYRPKILVVFPGYADLHLRDEKSPEEFENALFALLERDSAHGSTIWRYVIAPVQMPLHPGDRDRIAAMTRRSQNLAARMGRTTIIDPNPALRGLDGQPDPAFFLMSGINLSSEGYVRISMLLREKLFSQSLELVEIAQTQ